jgi:hypothetical protein
MRDIRSQMQLVSRADPACIADAAGPGESYGDHWSPFLLDRIKRSR